MPPHHRSSDHSHDPAPAPTSATRRTVSLTSLIVVPLKQHLGCCVIVPVLLKTVGSITILSSFLLLTPEFHFYLALALAPLVVWLCMKAEDVFHDWQHRRGHFTQGQAHSHTADCTSCAPCPVDHSRPGFQRRYIINLVIAVVVMAIIESFHHHTHSAAILP